MIGERPATFRRRKVDIGFDISISGDPQRSFKRWYAALRAHVPLIGRISGCDFSTLTAGESREPQTLASLEDALANDDIASFGCTCELHCTNIDGTPLIGGGLTAVIQFDRLDAPDLHAPLRAWLSLETDIYAAVSWGEVRDNRELARRNAPRFNEFLRRMATDLGGAFTVSESGYAGHVTDVGFVVPD